MNRLFRQNDIQRLCRDFGITPEEAASLLARVDGDPAKAAKLCAQERSVAVVEPEKVEDGPDSAFGAAWETLHGIFRKIRSARVRITRGNADVAEISLILALLAMLAAPHLMFGSVAVMFFLGFRFSVDGKARAAAAV